ncbi:Hypothetical predicted protein [Marmota monax]|uniref:Uncharacterized protein n=1 Tax=Marmota monax TaxID=9995 RepID=A0A5E4D5I1_MARMO|nr:hypothetical protein GHT09_000343 [Marmota monax]VTJ89474.1 Hypothetical predicted protein [Marmota monax]
MACFYLGLTPTCQELRPPPHSFPTCVPPPPHHRSHHSSKENQDSRDAHSGDEGTPQPPTWIIHAHVLQELKPFIKVRKSNMILSIVMAPVEEAPISTHFTYSETSSGECEILAMTARSEQPS